MKKKEYVSPEVEIVEITEQYILMASDGEGSNTKNPNPGGFPGTSGSRSLDDDED